jgi:ubiquinone/menaquinone biosynthesis C-methylase UbiE
MNYRNCFISAALALACLSAACGPRSVKPGINSRFENGDADAWAERWESESREIFRKRRALVEACGITDGQHVADIGAGTGLFVPLLSTAVGSNGRVYAADIIPQFLTHIDSRAQRDGLTNVHTVLGTDRSSGLSPASIDVAFVCATYHHFEFPEDMLQSIRSALRPQGRLIIIDFIREPGVSRAWILDHVRAGLATVVEEVRAAGFAVVSEGSSTPTLDENYMIQFRVTP